MKDLHCLYDMRMNCCQNGEKVIAVDLPVIEPYGGTLDQLRGCEYEEENCIRVFGNGEKRFNRWAEFETGIEVYLFSLESKSGWVTYLYSGSRVIKVGDRKFSGVAFERDEVIYSTGLMTEFVLAGMSRTVVNYQWQYFPVPVWMAPARIICREANGSIMKVAAVYVGDPKTKGLELTIDDFMANWQRESAREVSPKNQLYNEDYPALIEIESYDHEKSQMERVELEEIHQVVQSEECRVIVGVVSLEMACGQITVSEVMMHVVNAAVYLILANDTDNLLNANLDVMMKYPVIAVRQQTQEGQLPSKCYLSDYMVLHTRMAYKGFLADRVIYRIRITEILEACDRKVLHRVGKELVMPPLWFSYGSSMNRVRMWRII